MLAHIQSSGGGPEGMPAGRSHRRFGLHGDECRAKRVWKRHGRTSSSARARVASFAGQNGIGWGTHQPREIFNGGDPSGMIQAISWSTWGKTRTYGFGNAFIFRAPPLGGYYPHAVRVEPLASDLGRCTARGPLAYQHLEVREPTRPGGKRGDSLAVFDEVSPQVVAGNLGISG